MAVQLKSSQEVEGEKMAGYIAMCSKLVLASQGKQVASATCIEMINLFSWMFYLTGNCTWLTGIFLKKSLP